MKLYVPTGLASTRLYLEQSIQPAMRKVYKEAAQEKGGLFPYKANVFPQGMHQEVKEWKAETPSHIEHEALDGDEFHYSKEAYAELFTAMVITKHHWLEVLRSYALNPS